MLESLKSIKRLVFVHLGKVTHVPISNFFGACFHNADQSRVLVKSGVGLNEAKHRLTSCESLRGALENVPSINIHGMIRGQKLESENHSLSMSTFLPLSSKGN
jgi:hypothetical protein